MIKFVMVMIDGKKVVVPLNIVVGFCVWEKGINEPSSEEHPNFFKEYDNAKKYYRNARNRGEVVERPMPYTSGDEYNRIFFEVKCQTNNKETATKVAGTAVYNKYFKAGKPFNYNERKESIKKLRKEQQNKSSISYIHCESG